MWCSTPTNWLSQKIPAIRKLKAVMLTRPTSAMLAPDDLDIQALRDKHGREFEDRWRETFGFGFDCLTRSEARYLENSPDAQTIRDRLAAAGLESRPGPTAR